MFNDTFYLFPDYLAAETALDAAGLMQAHEDGAVGFGAPGHIVDMVGAVVDSPGVYDEDGNEIAPPTFVDGYHVNIRSRGAAPAGLAAYEIAPPATPARRWA